MFETVDGYTMIIVSTKLKDGFEISSAKYFGGGAVGELKKCFLAKKDNYTSHGKTIKQAVEDVNFKFMQATLNVDELVAEIKAKQTVSIAEYRLLTGACQSGTEHFLTTNKIAFTEIDSLPLDQVISMTKGAYGGDRIGELFS